MKFLAKQLVFVLICSCWIQLLPRERSTIQGFFFVVFSCEEACRALSQSSPRLQDALLRRTTPQQAKQTDESKHEQAHNITGDSTLPLTSAYP